MVNITRSEMRFVIGAAAVLSFLLWPVFDSEAAVIVSITESDLSLLKPPTAPFLEAGLLTTEQASTLERAKNPVNTEHRKENMALYEQLLSDTAIPYAFRRWAFVSKVAGLVWDDRPMEALGIAESWLAETDRVDYQLHLHLSCFLLSKLVDSQSGPSSSEKLARTDYHLAWLLKSKEQERFHEDTLIGLLELIEIRATLAPQAMGELQATVDYQSLNSTEKEIWELEYRTQTELKTSSAFDEVIAFADTLLKMPNSLRGYNYLGGGYAVIVAQERARLEQRRLGLKKSINTRSQMVEKLKGRSNSIPTGGEVAKGAKAEQD